MERTETPSPDELRSLLRGELEADQAHDLYRRLEQSDDALDLAEGIWAEESILTPGESPRLSRRRSELIERRVFASVHRTKLAEDVTGLGSDAFLHVVVELLRAVLSIFEPAEKTPKPTLRRTP